MFCPLALYSILIACGSFGCGSGNTKPTGSIRGSVRSLNKPVSQGIIGFFDPKTGFAVDYTLDAEGKFASKAKAPLPVAEYLVTVSPLAEMVDNDPGKTPPAPVEMAAPNIPMKFRRQATTPLRAKIAEGENEANFTLTP